MFDFNSATCTCGCQIPTREILHPNPVVHQASVKGSMIARSSARGVARRFEKSARMIGGQTPKEGRYPTARFLLPFLFGPSSVGLSLLL
jgi:hypothetical protein